MSGWVCPVCKQEGSRSYRCDKCGEGTCPKCCVRGKKGGRLFQMCPDCAKEFKHEHCERVDDE